MRITTGLIAAALLLAACSPAETGGETTTDDTPGETPASAAPGSGPVGGVGGGVTPFLVAFDSCDALLDHIHTEAAERVGPYGLDTSGWPWFWAEERGFVVEEEMAEAAEDSGGSLIDESASGPATTAAAGNGGDEEFTGTNVQELGVDEPDIVKTDGDRIITMSENVLSYVTLDGEPEVTDQLRIDEGWAHELFFKGDRAFLFTNAGEWGGPVPFPADATEETLAEPVWFGPAVTVTEVDISDPTDLEVVSTLRLQGQYLSARAVGDTIRMAMNTTPAQLPWVYPSSPAGEDRAEQFNRELVEETTIDDWIPGYELTDVSGSTTDGRLIECEDVSRPSEFSGFDFVSVLTFDLSGGLGTGDGVAVLASGQTVYSSLDRFYVATTEWATEEIQDEAGLRRWSEDYTTAIHAFDNTTVGAARYVASGEVDGSLLNQFSMDEHDGYLRVITTDGSPWDQGNQSETFLTVFAEEGETLTPVGEVGGLGKGEALYSARLMDDIGFAVTFRQIDPFYVLDLTDPENPRVTGELKIPGFSTYLHPVGDDLVLGVGQDATEDGMVTGLKVSLFSVADPENPLELDVWTMENANSPVEYDHRAFQFLPSENLAVIPALSWTSEFNGAVLLQVDDDRLIERGTVTQLEPGAEPTSDCRTLTSDDFPEDSEFYWMARDGHVQYCDSEDTGGYGTYSCEPIPVSEVENWFYGDPSLAEGVLEAIGAEEDGRIEMCWPDDVGWQEQIQRSLIVGDSLWTMSIRSLQANDMATLDVETKLPIT